ncbi:MAG: hypothetical protein M1281_02380 [Chloroflexi bacterium]|nr:hypothetical protein [Chloroflexota bacterium]
MNAVWFVRSRQINRSISWWLAITGYKTSDRSFSNRIYFVYLVIFFAIWGLTVLALVTSTVAEGLQAFDPARPVWLAAQITVVVFLAWWLWSLFEASRRSPIKFTEEDAALICATPAPRPAVAFAWLVSAWFTTGLLFWALAITLGFARAEIAVGGNPTWADAPFYLSAAGQLLLPVILLHLGMLAVVWAFGCLRLNGYHSQGSLNRYPLALGFIFTAGLVFGGFEGIFFQSMAWPASAPVLSGSGLANYLPGNLAGLAWAGLGMGALYLASRRLNLSRAAQETSLSGRLQAASILGDQKLAASIHLKQRLKSGSRPFPLPGRPGALALSWKQILQSVRAFGAGALYNWSIVFALSLAVLLAPNWGVRGVAALFWIAQLHARLTQSLRLDLDQWPLFQALPIRSSYKLLAEIAPPGVLAVLVGWAGIAIASLLAPGINLWGAALLLPLVIFDLACGAAWDVFRQARAELLLAGMAPSPSFLSLVLSGLILILFLLPFIFFNAGLEAVLVALLWGGGACYLLFSLASRSMRKLGK